MKIRYVILFCLIFLMTSSVNVVKADPPRDTLDFPSQCLAESCGYEFLRDKSGQAVLTARPETGPTCHNIDLLLVEQAILEKVNEDRREAGLAAVEWDETAAAASRQFAAEMAQNNYIAHWNLSGQKPQQRYTEAGGAYGTTENVCYSWQRGYKLSQDLVLDNVLKNQERMMAEEPPNDGHRVNILDPHHTHVGVGVAYALLADGAITVAFTQEFTNHYAEIKNIPAELRAGESFQVNGSLLRPGVKLYSLVLLWEEAPCPMSIDALMATRSYSSPGMDTMVSYALEDFPRTYFPNHTAAGSPLVMDEAGNFKAALQAGRQKGLNYLQLWLQDSCGNVFLGNELVIKVV